MVCPRSVFYMALRELRAAAVAQRTLVIKSKGCKIKPVDFLTRAESEAVMAGSNQTTWSGCRPPDQFLAFLQTL